MNGSEAAVPGSCWIGSTEPPFPVDHILLHLDDPPADDLSIVYVDGSGGPDGLPASSVREWLGDRPVPWIALVDPSAAPAWLEAGACGVLPPETAALNAPRLGTNILEKTVDAGARNPLTGLPGNSAIMRRLQEDVIEGGCTAAYLDITGFKPFNDYYGFARGDAVLRTLAGVLSECLGGRFFTGHLGGDDFVCTGSGEGFTSSLGSAVSAFRSRAPLFYSESDRTAGGIEALDRHGEFRFFPLLDVTVAIVDSRTPGETVESLASRAARIKREIKGEIPDLAPSEFLGTPENGTDCASFLEWYSSRPAGEKPDTRDGKALLEAAGMAGDREMTGCLSDVLMSSLVPDLRKSAAFSLGLMEDPDSLDALRRALSDPSPHVRTRAVEALARIGGVSAGPEIAGMTADGNTWVRRAALRGIGVSGWREGVGLLCESLERGWRTGRDGRDTVMERKAALEGIVLLGEPSASVHLARLWKTKGYSPMRELLEALYSTGTDAAVLVALELVQGDDSRYRGTLDCLRFDAAGEDLLRRLEDAAVEALARSGCGNREMLGLLARLPFPLNRRTLSALKEMIGSAREPGALVTALCTAGDRPDNSSVSRAVRRMTDCGREELVDLMRWASRGRGVRPGQLLPFLRHSSREVSTAAARAVLVLARRWTSPEFDHDGESLNI